MNKIGFKTSFSKLTNDFEVRVLVDGRDIISEYKDEAMGLDPEILFRQDELKIGGEAMVARCNCGYMGCSDWTTEILIGSELTSWSGFFGDFCFSNSDYIKAVDIASTDFSWEDRFRRAERLVEGVLHDMELVSGEKFDWVNARSTTKQIELCFWDGEHSNKLFHIGWDGLDAATALASAEKFLAKYSK